MISLVLPLTALGLMLQPPAPGRICMVASVDSNVDRNDLTLTLTLTLTKPLLQPGREPHTGGGSRRGLVPPNLSDHHGVQDYIAVSAPAVTLPVYQACIIHHLSRFPKVAQLFSSLETAVLPTDKG